MNNANTMSHLQDVMEELEHDAERLKQLKVDLRTVKSFNKMVTETKEKTVLKNRELA